jgi:hypothetical protein
LQLKRQHSAEPLTESSSTRKSPYLKGEEDESASTPRSVNSTTAHAGTPPKGMSPAALDPPEVIGSPFKRQRASLPGGLDDALLNPLGSTNNNVYPPALPQEGSNGVAPTQPAAVATPASGAETKMVDEDEEL